MGKVLEFKKKSESKLTVNHNSGIISGQGDTLGLTFNERLARIRESMEKINNLMRQLKEEASTKESKNGNVIT